MEVEANKEPQQKYGVLRKEKKKKSKSLEVAPSNPLVKNKRKVEWGSRGSAHKT